MKIFYSTFHTIFALENYSLFCSKISLSTAEDLKEKLKENKRQEKKKELEKETEIERGHLIINELKARGKVVGCHGNHHFDHF